MARREKKYWLFQCRPRLLKVRDALRFEHLQTFPVRSHQRSIRIGDVVILWRTGTQAACYGLAEVSTQVYQGPPEAEEMPYYLHPQVEQRVGIRILYNLWDRPLTKSAVQRIPPLKKLLSDSPVLIRKASVSQFQAIERWVEQQNVLAEPLPDYETPPLSRPAQNILLYGPPGTGKTYHSLTHALSIIEGREVKELSWEDRRQLRRRYERYVREGRIAFVTFHPGFSYEDFVEGVKPVVHKGQLRYELQDGILKTLAEAARVSLQQEMKNADVTATEQAVTYLAKAKKYVIIIDELNRGDVAAIFGELITLLESDKREGRAEVLYATLPYSREAFALPANLYVVATMNTVDRNAQQLDLALRRRFSFRKMPPDPDVIAQAARSPKPSGVDLRLLLIALNERIEVRLGADYQLGHAYFLGIENLEDLRTVFARHILPLLGEYFYNDADQLAEILGDHFFQKQLKKLKDPAELSEVDFISLYEDRLTRE